MADSGSGASGILGVLVGIMLVILVGAGLMMYSGRMGSGPSNITIKMPAAN